MILIDPGTRQFNIPGADLTFGVESDAGSERKYFQCPRYVGNNLDLMSCFVRMNFRNANGQMDSYLVEDVAVDGENVTFSWVLSHKVTAYKGAIKFVVCAVGPDQKVEWHTTLGTGQVLEGLEPDAGIVEAGTSDVVAQLIAMVERQTTAVEAEGGKQIEAVRVAAKAAEAAAVAEIEAKGVNTRDSIPDDYTAMQGVVDGLVRGCADAIVCEATGSVISVDDASDNYVQSLRIFGRSTQDHTLTPTPTEPVEIVSVESSTVTVCGKNLIPPTTGAITAQGMTSQPVDSGTVLLNGTATQELSRVVSQNFLLPSGKYTLSVKDLHIVDGNKDRVYLNAADGSGTIVNYVMAGKPVTFEMTKSDIVRVAIVFAAGSAYTNEVVSIQLETGEAATEYELYKVQTIEAPRTLRGIPVTSGGNYTDENGQQWICDEVDLERGVFVQRVNKKTLTEADIAYTGTGYFEFGTYVFTTIRDARIAPTDVVVISDKLLGIRADYRTGSGFDDKYRCYAQDGTVYLRFPAGTGEKTLAECKEEFAGVTVQYALATPVETPLSEAEIAAYRALRSNYPHTTVLNTAPMTLRYAADTKRYIDNKIAAMIGG